MEYSNRIDRYNRKWAELSVPITIDTFICPAVFWPLGNDPKQELEHGCLKAQELCFSFTDHMDINADLSRADRTVRT